MRASTAGMTTGDPGCCRNEVIPATPLQPARCNATPTRRFSGATCGRSTGLASPPRHQVSRQTEVAKTRRQNDLARLIQLASGITPKKDQRVDPQDECRHGHDRELAPPPALANGIGAAAKGRCSNNKRRLQTEHRNGGARLPPATLNARSAPRNMFRVPL